MGAGSIASLSATTRSAEIQAGSSWYLTPDVAAQTQGLIASAFAHLPEAIALFVELPPQAGGAWLGKLSARVPITDAKGRAPGSSSAIAFTASGLMAMGLPRAVMAGFSPQFVEGMREPGRQRRLGDDNPSMVINGGPLWSGNAPLPTGADASQAVPSTKLTVHVLLLLYEADDAALQTLAADARQTVSDSGVTIVHEIRLSLHADPRIADNPREHFGFADGLSQPVPFGAPIVSKAGVPYPIDPLHGIAAGDLLLGHVNAHGEPAPGPLVPDANIANGPERVLPNDGVPHGMRDLGRNGSYLVVRELRQDVAAFWRSLDDAAAAIARPGIDADWLATRIIGRDRDGKPLVPPEAVPVADQGDPSNDFRFVPHDMHGLTCPMGSHMRRANPRDGLAPTANDASALLHAANNHRLMRRGRKYGAPIADPRVDDGENRGLLFMCLNTDLPRQFEFVQQTWMLNPGFAVLDGETDPLMGPPGTMTIPFSPLRLRPQVQTYVRLAGGDYFFVPSLPALRYLAAL